MKINSNMFMYTMPDGSVKRGDELTMDEKVVWVERQKQDLNTAFNDTRFQTMIMEDVSLALLQLSQTPGTVSVLSQAGIITLLILFIQKFIETEQLEEVFGNNNGTNKEEKK